MLHKIRIESIQEYKALAREWPPDFRANHEPTHYPCVVVYEHIETVQAVIVYADDFVKDNKVTLNTPRQP